MVCFNWFVINIVKGLKDRIVLTSTLRGTNNYLVLLVKFFYIRFSPDRFIIQ